MAEATPACVTAAIREPQTRKLMGCMWSALASGSMALCLLRYSLGIGVTRFFMVIQRGCCNSLARVSMAAPVTDRERDACTVVK